MSSAYQKHRLSGRPQAQITASGSALAGTPKEVVHFGLLDVPYPDPARPSDAKRSGSSLDQPQNAGTHPPAVLHSAETAVQAVRSGNLLNQDSARGRDAGAATMLGGHRSVQGNSDAARSYGRPTGSWSPSQRAIRPRAISLVHSGDSRGKATSMQQHMNNAVVPMGGVEASKLEGSATSDDNMQPRLVPRRGAGPDLRSEGGKIDEYLMRLLRTGSSPATPVIFTQVSRAVEAQAEATSLSAPRRRQDGVQWQGSRLGPLAPGAGIKSSSLPPVQPAASAPATAIAEQVPVRQQSGAANVDTATLEDKPDSSRYGRHSSLASQPSTTGSDTSQDALQKSQSAQFGNLGTSERGTTARKGTHGSAEQTNVGNRSSDDRQKGSTVLPQRLADRTRELLGEQLWVHVRQMIANQEQELQQQLGELHRLVAEQERLCVQQAAALVQPSTSPQGSHPPLFVGQSSGSMPRPQNTVNSNAWWLNAMPWASNLNSGAVSWPATSNAKQASAGASSQQESGAATGRQLSRTSQMVLEAQKARRSHKSRTARSGAKSHDTGTAQPVPAAQTDGGPIPPTSTGVPQSGQQESGAQQEQPAAPLASASHPQQQQQQPATWFSSMQPYFQAQHGGARPQQGAIDPLAAWYHFHFGQHSGSDGNAARPGSANYGSHLAGVSTAVAESGWENACREYFNFSMPGTSDNKTANTANTSSLQQPSFWNQAGPASLQPQQQQQQQGSAGQQGLDIGHNHPSHFQGFRMSAGTQAGTNHTALNGSSGSRPIRGTHAHARTGSTIRSTGDGKERN